LRRVAELTGLETAKKDPETRQTTRPRLRQKPFMPLGHPQFRHDVRGRIEIAWNQPAGRKRATYRGEAIAGANNLELLEK
jgi:hypothetical protein